MSQQPTYTEMLDEALEGLPIAVKLKVYDAVGTMQKNSLETMMILNNRIKLQANTIEQLKAHIEAIDPQYRVVATAGTYQQLTEKSAA